MDFHQFEFRDAEKYYLLSLRSQYFVIKIVRFLSSLLFVLSVFVIIWLFLFSFFTHPDQISCKTIKNIFYPRLDEITNWGFTNYYDVIKKTEPYNQTINCSSTNYDIWSCLEIYLHNNRKEMNLKNNLNYHQLTEYLNNHRKNAFGHNYLLNCVIEIKTIDRLFNCWLEFTCDYKVILVLIYLKWDLNEISFSAFFRYLLFYIRFF